MPLTKPKPPKPPPRAAIAAAPPSQGRRRPAARPACRARRASESAASAPSRHLPDDAVRDLDSLRYRRRAEQAMNHMTSISAHAARSGRGTTAQPLQPHEPETGMAGGSSAPLPRCAVDSQRTEISEGGQVRAGTGDQDDLVDMLAGAARPGEPGTIGVGETSAAGPDVLPRGRAGSGEPAGSRKSVACKTVQVTESRPDSAGGTDGRMRRWPRKDRQAKPGVGSQPHPDTGVGDVHALDADDGVELRFPIGGRHHLRLRPSCSGRSR